MTKTAINAHVSTFQKLSKHISDHPSSCTIFAHLCILFQGVVYVVKKGYFEYVWLNLSHTVNNI